MRGQRGGMKRRSNVKRHVNYKHIINISAHPTLTGTKLKEHVKMSVMNVQSIKNRDLLVNDYIYIYHEEEIDLAVFTETGLNDNDDIWIESLELNKNGYKLNACNRTSHKGGDLGLLYRDNMKIKVVRQEEKITFQYAVWNVQVRNITFTILGIYRPPYSNKTKTTTNMFLDEFIEGMKGNIKHLFSYVRKLTGQITDNPAGKSDIVL